MKKVLICLFLLFGCYIHIEGKNNNEDIAELNKLNYEIKPALLQARIALKNTHISLELDSILDSLLAHVENQKINRSVAIEKITKIKTSLMQYRNQQYTTRWNRLFGRSSRAVIDVIDPALARVDYALKILASSDITDGDLLKVFAGLGGAVLITGASAYAIRKSRFASKFPQVQIPELSNLVLPDGGKEISIYNYQIQCPILASSKPKECMYLYYKGSNIIELPVLQQNSGIAWQGNPLYVGTFDGKDKIYTMKQLKSADRLNCGYHALKNVIYMIAACQNFERNNFYEAKKLLYRMQDVSSFTHLLTSWLQYVIPFRYKQPDQHAYKRYPFGDFPVGTELENLLGIDGMPPLIPLELEKLYSDGLHSHIMIIDSFLELKQPEFLSVERFNLIQQIVTCNNGVYGFVVNDAAANETFEPNSGLHWVGYVLWKKDGQSFWIYTDSLCSRHNQVTAELIQIFSGHEGAV